MARPRRISDEQITDTMRTMVLRHGPNVSLEMVSQALGVTTPALLKRYKSREALMLAALRPPENPEWLQDLANGPTNEPLEGQLNAIFSRIHAFLMEVMPCVHALRESGIPKERAFANTPSPEENIKALQKWLMRAKRKNLLCATELESAAHAILGAIQMRAVISHLFGRAYSERANRTYVADLARLFTRSLTTTSPHTSRSSSVDPTELS